MKSKAALAIIVIAIAAIAVVLGLHLKDYRDTSAKELEAQQKIASQLEAISGRLEKLANPSASGRSESNELCAIFDIDAMGNCKPGSKIMFLPLRWGNDQLPIVAVGRYCDLNYPVVWNNGGVTCIRARLSAAELEIQKEEQEEAAKKQAAEQGASNAKDGKNDGAKDSAKAGR
jgi:hypothetical protein